MSSLVQAVFLDGHDPQSRCAREFLKRRGISVEDATDSFLRQFPDCKAPTVFLAGQAFEGLPSIRDAADLLFL